MTNGPPVFLRGILAATTLLGAGVMMEKAAFADTQAVAVTSAMQSEALADARQVNFTVKQPIGPTGTISGFDRFHSTGANFGLVS